MVQNCHGEKQLAAATANLSSFLSYAAFLMHFPYHFALLSPPLGLWCLSRPLLLPSVRQSVVHEGVFCLGR